MLLVTDAGKVSSLAGRVHQVFVLPLATDGRETEATTSRGHDVGKREVAPPEQERFPDGFRQRLVIALRTALAEAG